VIILNQLFRFARATNGRVEGSDIPGNGLVRDGTSCGDNLVIITMSFKSCKNCYNSFNYLQTIGLIPMTLNY